MPMDAVLPDIILRRKRKEKEKENAKRKKPYDGIAEDVYEVEGDRIENNDGAKQEESYQIPVEGQRREFTDAGGSVTYSTMRTDARQTVANEWSAKLDKERLVERLVLEEVMFSIFSRCIIFVVLFFLLAYMMWLSFPSTSFRPVHEAIIDGFDLDDSFQKISTVQDVRQYLKKAAVYSHAFSPGSVMYVRDEQSRSFLPSPRLVPPAVEVAAKQFPTLSANFSIGAWIKTSVRTDTIIQKTSKGKICWKVGLEGLWYGEHDAYTGVSFVPNPAATSIHESGTPGKAWRQSQLKEEMEDGQWHHFAVTVTNAQGRREKGEISFYHDGKKVENRRSCTRENYEVVCGPKGEFFEQVCVLDPESAGDAESPGSEVRTCVARTKILPKPMSDCEEDGSGSVTIGSHNFTTEMCDLVYFPRVLNNAEVLETYVTGRPIDVTVSGSGPIPSGKEKTQKQALAEKDLRDEKRFDHVKDDISLGLRRMFHEIKKDLPNKDDDCVDTDKMLCSKLKAQCANPQIKSVCCETCTACIDSNKMLCEHLNTKDCEEQEIKDKCCARCTKLAAETRRLTAAAAPTPTEKPVDEISTSIRRLIKQEKVKRKLSTGRCQNVEDDSDKCFKHTLDEAAFVALQSRRARRSMDLNYEDPLGLLNQMALYFDDIYLFPSLNVTLTNFLKDKGKEFPLASATRLNNGDNWRLKKELEDLHQVLYDHLGIEERIERLKNLAHQNKIKRLKEEEDQESEDETTLDVTGEIDNFYENMKSEWIKDIFDGLLQVHRSKCREKTYRDACPRTCNIDCGEAQMGAPETTGWNLWSVFRSPSREQNGNVMDASKERKSSKSLLSKLQNQCVDDNTKHMDFMNSPCSWYQLNDKNCHLASEATKKACNLTCHQCNVEYAALKAVAAGDEYLSMKELNDLLISVNREDLIITNSLELDWATYFCCKHFQANNEGKKSKWLTIYAELEGGNIENTINRFEETRCDSILYPLSLQHYKFQYYAAFSDTLRQALKDDFKQCNKGDVPGIQLSWLENGGPVREFFSGILDYPEPSMRPVSLYVSEVPDIYPAHLLRAEGLSLIKSNTTKLTTDLSRYDHLLADCTSTRSGNTVKCCPSPDGERVVDCCIDYKERRVECPVRVISAKRLIAVKVPIKEGKEGEEDDDTTTSASTNAQQRFMCVDKKTNMVEPDCCQYHNTIYTCCRNVQGKIVDCCHDENENWIPCNDFVAPLVVSAERFSKPAQGFTLDNFPSLTFDNADFEWPKCTVNNDCRDFFVYRCGFHTDPELRKLCEATIERVGYSSQATYCSSTCFTGRCKPEYKSWCQPCDTCLKNNAKSDCPSTCADGQGSKNSNNFIIGQKRLINAKRHKEDEDRRSGKVVEQITDSSSVKGAFTISVWIKGFQNQNILAKEVAFDTFEVPHQDSMEGYDRETKTLKCWTLNIEKMCARTHVWDPFMTCINNPLSHMLMDDEWHHLVVVKNVTESRVKNLRDSTDRLDRRAELLFYVDGKLGRSEKSDSDQIGPWHLNDCGGPYVSTAEVRRPFDHVMQGQDNSFLSEALRTTLNVDLDDVLALGSKNGWMGMRFNLNVPRGAKIVYAKFELCASRSPLAYWEDKTRCRDSDEEHREKDKKEKKKKKKKNSRIIPISINYHKDGGEARDPISHSCEDEKEEKKCTGPCSWDETLEKCKGGLFNICSLGNVNRAGLSDSPVPWFINQDEWEKTPVRPKEDSETNIEFDEIKNIGCTRYSPDVSSLVQKLVNESWYKGDGEPVTFNFAQPGIKFNSENCLDDHFNMTTLKGMITNNSREGICAVLKDYRKILEESFPLFATSKQGSGRNRSAFAPKLTIYWCDGDGAGNGDCMHPTFAGVGQDQVWGKGPHLVRSNDPLVRNKASSVKLEFEDNDPVKAAEKVVPGEFKVAQRNGAFRLLVGKDASNPELTPIANGVMIDLRLASRALPPSEVQRLYYNGLNLVKGLPGMQNLVTLGSEGTKIDVEPYTKGVVSIMPPTLMQLRSPLTSCEGYPMREEMTHFFRKQTGRKCDQSMEGCEFPSIDHRDHAFLCVDRTRLMADLSPLDGNNERGVGSEHEFDGDGKPQEEKKFGSHILMHIPGGQYFNRNPAPGGAMNLSVYFPEFLEMMTLDTVYRGGKMQPTEDWVDLQSSTIFLYNVFLTPSLRMGTVLELTFESSSVGIVTTKYSLSSFQGMSDIQELLWVILGIFIAFLCIVEVGLILSDWIFRQRDRGKWMNLARAYGNQAQIGAQANASLYGRCDTLVPPDTPGGASGRKDGGKIAVDDEYKNQPIQTSTSSLQAQNTVRDAALIRIEQAERRRLRKREALIAKNNPIIEFWDVFDLLLRFSIFGFVAVYVVENQPRFREHEAGVMENYLLKVLSVQWENEYIPYHEKVQKFNAAVLGLLQKVQRLLTFRIFGAILISTSLFRIIVYMRVHPRVAILYKTVATTIDDLFHFFITFSFLYVVLAFIATWTFGAFDERYATIGDSLYSQFNMIIGEFPMDPVPEMQHFYTVYLCIFCVLMYWTVMNFLLAIIIDSYAAIKEQVDECMVAKNFLEDLYHSLIYRYYRWQRNWPSRWQLIDKLLRADLDGDDVNDEEQSFAVAVEAEELFRHEIFPDLDSATGFVNHYLGISQHLAGTKKNSKGESALEHRIVLKRLLQLDLVSHDLRGYSRDVHPLGRRAEETKALVKQLVRTGQKILHALRINRREFMPDQLGVSESHAPFLGAHQTYQYGYSTQMNDDGRPTIRVSDFQPDSTSKKIII